jgi:SAM-dependent methyltransferase
LLDRYEEHFLTMETTDTPAARARSFDAWAGEYDRFRPGYPGEMFETIGAKLGLPTRPLVVDLGAGTGRASLAMAARGWRVTAVEPGKAMLSLLRDRASDDGLVVSTIEADAEATGLDPMSVDLVTAAQAFHWFAQEEALAEITRILRPGGRLVVIGYYGRDQVATLLEPEVVALARDATQRRTGWWLRHGFRIKVVHSRLDISDPATALELLPRLYGERGRAFLTAPHPAFLTLKLGLFHLIKR